MGPVFVTARREDDAFETVGQSYPVGDKFEEILQVALRDNVAKASTGRFPVNDVTSMPRR
jgi:hypothetical protein